MRPRLLLVALLALVTSLLELGPLERAAHAIIGRPLTPLSFAGVARRTTRRAYGYGGPMAMAPPMYGPMYGPVYW
jgi:hypothetical protein